MAHHGGQFDLGDSHHTSVHVNPTHVDPSTGTVCGHVGVITHPFSSAPNVEMHINTSGCITDNGHGGVSATDFSGHGVPGAAIGFGYNW